jgi:hypothetical protein
MQVRGLSGEKAAALVERYSTPARYPQLGPSGPQPLPSLREIQLNQCSWEVGLALCGLCSEMDSNPDTGVGRREGDIPPDAERRHPGRAGWAIETGEV